MIRSIIIGKEADVEIYSQLISSSKYFGNYQPLIISEEMMWDNVSFQEFNAVVIVSPVPDCEFLFSKLFRLKQPAFFLDQPDLNNESLSRLNNLFEEASSLAFPEVPYLFHPLVQEFLTTNSQHLLFRYSKNISSRKQIRSTVLTALSFLSLLSPMQVKKFNIGTIESTNTGKPMIKIRLKLYDSSVAYIMLKMEKENDHNLLLESQKGILTFNFSENYLENAHGKKFICDPTTELNLKQKAIDEFALHIILNSKPTFNFHHYSLAHKSLSKIENILLNTF